MSEDEAAAAAMRGLDRGELTDFLADLWTARGWRVEREGATLRVRDGEEERVLAPMPASWLPDAVRSIPENADAVVTPDAGAFAGADSEVIGPGDLVSMLRYGVPPETADRLCRAHLGAPLDALEAPLPVRVRRSLAGLPLRRAGVAVALLAAAAMLTLTLPLNSLLAAGTGPATTNQTGGTAAPASVVSPDAGAVEPTTTTEIRLTEVDIEWLNESAVTAASVAEAHRGALYSLPYELSLTYTVTDRSGETRTQARTVSQIGERFVVQERDSEGEEYEVYDNGSAAFVAHSENGSTVYRRAETDPPDPRNRSPRLVERYLAAEDLEVRGTTTVDGVQTVLVVTEGTPVWLTTANYSAEAMYDQNGLIRRMTVTYERPDGATVRIRWRYRELELGEFEPPSWYEREFAT